MFVRVKKIGGYEYLPIDTTTTVKGTSTDLDQAYASSNALATVLASSPTVASCAPTLTPPRSPWQRSRRSRVAGRWRGLFAPSYGGRGSEIRRHSSGPRTTNSRHLCADASAR